MKVECNNCDWVGKAEDVDKGEVEFELLDPGSEVPAGCCPKCGALCYLVDRDNPYAAKEHNNAAALSKLSVALDDARVNLNIGDVEGCAMLLDYMAHIMPAEFQPDESHSGDCASRHHFGECTCGKADKEAKEAA